MVRAHCDLEASLLGSLHIDEQLSRSDLFVAGVEAEARHALTQPKGRRDVHPWICGSGGQPPELIAVGNESLASLRTLAETSA